MFQKQGLVKAGLSKAFMTDFVPGVVMALLFGQMILLALPIRLALGDSYSPAKAATQVERLLVATGKGQSLCRRWTDRRVGQVYVHYKRPPSSLIICTLQRRGPGQGKHYAGAPTQHDNSIMQI